MVAGPKYTKIWLSDKTTATSVMSIEHNTTEAHRNINYPYQIDKMNLLLPSSEVFSTQNDPPTISRFYGNNFIPFSEDQKLLLDELDFRIPTLNSLVTFSPNYDYSSPYNSNNIVEYIFVQSAAGINQYNVSGLVLNQAQVTSNVIGYSIGK